MIYHIDNLFNKYNKDFQFFKSNFEQGNGEVYILFLLFERKISPGNLVKRNFPRNVYTDGKGIYLSGEIVNQLLRTEHILKQIFVREIEIGFLYNLITSWSTE